MFSFREIRIIGGSTNVHILSILFEISEKEFLNKIYITRGILDNAVQHIYTGCSVLEYRIINALKK